MTAFANGDRWFRRFHPGPQNAPRVVCFPHAGGAASSYLQLSKELSPSVEVWAVQYPGRQERRREPHFTTMQELAEWLVGVLGTFTNRPLAFFGHSMGAIAAFEVARQLEHAGVPLVALFVSGRRAPSTHRDEQLNKRDDNGLIAEIRSLSGTDTRLLDDDDILQMILPTIRADLRAIEAYSYQPGRLLRSPVVALVGDDDPKATIDEVRLWAKHTTGQFELHIFAGGHFFLDKCQADVARIVLNRLSRTVVH